MFNVKRLWICIFFAISLSLLGLTGCDSQPSKPVSGTVVHKDYDTGHYSRTGKRRTIWVNADWDITVQDAAGKEHEIEVTESQYNHIRVGDYFTEGK